MIWLVMADHAAGVAGTMTRVLYEREGVGYKNAPEPKVSQTISQMPLPWSIKTSLLIDCSNSRKELCQKGTFTDNYGYEKNPNTTMV